MNLIEYELAALLVKPFIIPHDGEYSKLRKFAQCCFDYESDEGLFWLEIAMLDFKEYKGIGFYHPDFDESVYAYEKEGIAMINVITFRDSKYNVTLIDIIRAYLDDQIE